MTRAADGHFAEDCAETFQFTRAVQDEYALASLSRALEAQKARAFADEITPLTSTPAKARVTISADEQPASARQKRFRMLKPAFREGGTVTAANSSSISDGAAALVLASA